MRGLLFQSGVQNKVFSLLQVTPLKEGHVENISDISIDTMELGSGDLLRVFNSVTGGDELFKVTVNLQRDQYGYHWQQDFDRPLWSHSFLHSLPAKLKTIHGAEVGGTLAAVIDGGDSSPVWSVVDLRKGGHDAPVPIENGDTLTVFTGVTEGSILWEGRIACMEEPFDTGNLFTGTTIDPVNKKVEIYIGEPEIWSKTYTSPPPASLDLWTRHHMPAQVLR